MMITIDNFNEQIKSGILKTVSGGRRPHAVLIDGGSEKEREDIAYFLAKIYVCGNATESESCNECSSCRKSDERIHPDIIKVTKPDDKKFFRKEDVKQIVEDSFQTPNEASKRVFILSEMQLMKDDSQNVLLKILEEPPVYTAFIITADNANSIIGTVLSRVSRLRIGESDSDITFSEKVVEVVKNTAVALSFNYEYDVIHALAPLDGNKQLTVDVLVALSVFFRDALSVKYNGKVLFSELEQEAKNISYSFSAETLLKHYEAVEELIKLTSGTNPYYPLLVAQLCAKLKSN